MVSVHSALKSWCLVGLGCRASTCPPADALLLACPINNCQYVGAVVGTGRTISGGRGVDAGLSSSCMGME